jgi:hypothetical protein
MDEKEKPPTQWIRPQGIASTSQFGSHTPTTDESEEESEEKDEQ